MVMESVYGDRNHGGTAGRRNVLRDALVDTHARGGVLLIPSFSLQRTQILLSEINELLVSGKVPSMPVFLDSPLAIRVLDVYRSYPNLYNERIREQFTNGKDPFDFEHLTLTPRTEDSASIQSAPSPKIIIAGSGMSHGGRIRGHEKRYLNDKNAMVLFVGYQTVGSLGRRIKDGAKKVYIDGDPVRVKAEIRSLDGYSAHRDMDGLMDFVEDTAESLIQVFVAMGEPKTSLFLTQRLRDFLGVNATAPNQGASYTLDW